MNPRGSCLRIKLIQGGYENPPRGLLVQKALVRWEEVQLQSKEIPKHTSEPSLPQNFTFLPHLG